MQKGMISHTIPTLKACSQFPRSPVHCKVDILTMRAPPIAIDTCHRSTPFASTWGWLRWGPGLLWWPDLNCTPKAIQKLLYRGTPHEHLLYLSCNTSPSGCFVMPSFARWRPTPAAGSVDDLWERP